MHSVEVEEGAPSLSKGALGDQHSVPGGREDTEDPYNIDCPWILS